MTKVEAQTIIDELLDEYISVDVLTDEYARGYIEGLKTAITVIRSYHVPN